MPFRPWAVVVGSAILARQVADVDLNALIFDVHPLTVGPEPFVLDIVHQRPHLAQRPSAARRAGRQPAPRRLRTGGHAGACVR